ncbi:hypothetical protein OG730_39245 [Streptomyces sp. NBC_01298]|nr:hypothetical protein OG730_39245 [Streptomyces sp. NBC_01298]
MSIDRRTSERGAPAATSGLPPGRAAPAPAMPDRASGRHGVFVTAD